MKRLLLLFLALVLLFLPLASCANSKTEDTRPVIVSSIFPMYDFSRVLLGERANCVILLPSGADAHSYEPTPQDLALIAKADLFLCIGGQDDFALTKTVATLPETEVMTFLDCAATHNEAHEHEHEHGHEHTDEHIWVNPENARRMVKKLADKFCTLYPELSSSIRENEAAYDQQLALLSASYREKAPAIQTLVFADSFPFLHLTEEYDLSYLSAISGCGEDSEPSAQQIGTLITTIKKEHISTIFYTEKSNGKIAQTIAAETNTRTVRVHSCHNLTDEERADGVTYLSLMEENLACFYNASL